MDYFSDLNSLNNPHGMSAEYGNAGPSIGGSHQFTDAFQPSNNDFMNDDQVNFFDFEPHQTTSPLREQLSSSDHSDPFSSWNSSSLHPLSPPNSALFSSPKNRQFIVHAQAPPSILTSIDPASTRAQYGQVTPPDDETPGQFSPRHRQSQPVTTAPSAAAKKRKRSSATNAQKPKRSRKNAALSVPFDPQNVDPNSPEQVRRLKFLERNRVAASKCRQKKKQWIDKTEAQAREMQSHNNSLRLLVESLSNEIQYVKAQMVRHMDCESSEIKSFIKQRHDAFADAIRTYEQYEKNSKITSAEIPRKEDGVDDERGKGSEQVSSDKPPSSPAAHLERNDSLQTLLTGEVRQGATEEGAT